MHEEIRAQLIIQDFPSFHHLINRTRILENERRMMETNRKRKLAAQRPQGSYTQRLVYHGNPSFRPVVALPLKALTPRPSGNVLCTPCPSGNLPAAHLHCFSCGERGRFANRYPNHQVSPVKFNMGATPARGQESTPSKSHQTLQASRTDSTPNQGLVNHITTEEAQESTGVLMGFYGVLMRHKRIG